VTKLIVVNSKYPKKMNLTRDILKNLQILNLSIFVILFIISSGFSENVIATKKGGQ